MTNLLLLSFNGSSILLLLLYVLFIGIYLWLCYEVGKYAERLERSFWLFFFISLVFNPIVGFIIALLIREGDEINAKRIRREVKNALEEERNNQQPQTTQDIQDYQDQEIEE